MSRSKHPRKKQRLYSNHRRKDKQWKRDSLWKPAERPAVVDEPRPERRSPRTRLR